jgi:putative intracellular protease/amidase
MKAKAIVLVSIILVVAVFSGPLVMPSVEAQDVSDVKVLMLLTELFGWNYFDAKSILESWGVNVTTIAYALDTNVTGCFNKPDNWTIADHLLLDVESDIVTQFDALFIPSGGHWAGLISSSTVLNFIEYAHTHGILIATTCIGNRVVASSNDIVNGTSVVNYDNPNSKPAMISAGAEIRYGYEAVTDNRIITGNTGGGVSGGGYLLAPTSEVCTAMVREALGYSYVEQASVLPLTGESGTTFDISAEVTDLDTELGSFSTVDTNISEVQARIFTKDNRTLVDTIELTDTNGDWVYTGSFSGTIDGEYVIDIEVEDTNSTLEVERELASFTIGEEGTSTTTTTNETTSSSSTGFVLDPLLLGGITAGGVAVLVIVVIVVKKR